MRVSLAPLQTALRAAFFIAATVTLVLALAPTAGPTIGNADKVQHFLAFYVLTLAGAAAFRSRRSLRWLTAGMAFYGALIEVLQAVTPFGRSPDIKDWLVDLLGISAVVAPLLLGAWRDRGSPSS